MTSTVMMTPKQAQQEWGKVFPEDFTTMEGSCLFIKKLIAVSLSSITYLRGVFPEQAYGERSLCGIKLKILTEDSGIPAVSKFINTIRSCYDAVDKKYLQQMSLGICPNSQKRDEVIEAYNLVFRYKEDEYSITCNNNRKIFSPNLSNPTVKATLTLLQNLCQLDEVLTPLPPHASLNMKLLYYDDITPPDYEPEGFEPSSTSKFQFPKRAVNISLGQIATDFHSYKFVLKTANAINYTLTQPSSEDPVMTGSQDRAETARDATDNHQSSKEIISDSWKSDKDEKIQKSKRCPCTCTERQDDDIIVCTGCQSKQHKICYGILKNEDIPENFYCNDCFYNHSDGMPETDLVYNFKGKELEEFCAMRRALVICSQLKTLTTANLAKLLGCTTALTNTLIDRLEEEKFLTKRTTKKSGYNVEKEHILNVGIPQYFPLRKKQGCVKPQNRLSRKKIRKDENAKRSHEEEDDDDDDDKYISNNKKRNKSIVEKFEVISIHSSPEILQSQNSRKRSSSQVFSSQEVFQSTNKKKRAHF